MMYVHNAKTGLELLKGGRWQAFHHDIRKLLRRGNVKNSNILKSHLLMNKVDIEPDMLVASMMNRIGEEIDAEYIVPIHHIGLVDRKTKLVKELAKPGALSNSVSHCSILLLGTRMGYRGLSNGPRKKQYLEVERPVSGQ